MKLNFQQEVLCLPASVLNHADADATAMRVLLWLSSDLSLAQKPKQLAKLSDCDVKTAQAALRFWCECGVLTAEESTDAPTKQTPVSASASSAETTVKKNPLLSRADELPVYTSAELAELMETRATLRTLINEAQQILGKMFNPSDLNILIGMFDYLGISEEGILMILAHCKRIGKVNLRAIEKYAYSLVDRDIIDPTALEEEFRTVEALRSFEGEVRSMFGMKSRALTAKESKMLRAWVSYGYDVDIVRRAYEMTVNATNEPSVAYTNAIIERWHSEGLNTAEAIDASLREQQDKKDGKSTVKKNWTPTLGNSFDTDDFFQAALQRSFRETGVAKDTDRPTENLSERK